MKGIKWYFCTLFVLSFILPSITDITTTVKKGFSEPVITSSTKKTTLKPTEPTLATSIPTKARCNSTKLIHQKERAPNISCYNPSDPLQCFHDPLFCDKHFQSGKRTLQKERPKYGEYRYLEQYFWFRVIQHGGVAFLYNPCSNEEEIGKLRELAGGCLRRHVITPSEMLGDTFPIALISWGCYYGTSSVNKTDMKAWIREHAFKGPASHIHDSGTYHKRLVKGSNIVTDTQDSVVCPNQTEMARFTTTTVRPAEKITKSVGEKIIHDRIQHIQHGHVPTNHVRGNFTSKKVHPGSAAWAASSLFFLCGILLVWLFYTKAWAPQKNKDYNYEQVLSNEYEFEPSSGGFSLLKSSQSFINIFRMGSKKSREKKLDSLSSVNLMVPINEEDEDSEEYET